MPKCCLALCLPLHITTEHYNLTSNQSVWFKVYTDLLNTISSLSSTHTQSPFVPFQYLLSLLWPFTIQMLKLLFLFYFCILYLHDQLWKEYFDHVWIGHVGAIKINELYLWESSNYSWIFRLFFFIMIIFSFSTRLKDIPMVHMQSLINFDSTVMQIFCFKYLNE